MQRGNRAPHNDQGRSDPGKWSRGNPLRNLGTRQRGRKERIASGSSRVTSRSASRGASVTRERESSVTSSRRGSRVSVNTSAPAVAGQPPSLRPHPRASPLFRAPSVVGESSARGSVHTPSLGRSIDVIHPQSPPPSPPYLLPAQPPRSWLAVSQQRSTMVQASPRVSAVAAPPPPNTPPTTAVTPTTPATPTVGQSSQISTRSLERNLMDMAQFTSRSSQQHIRRSSVASFSKSEPPTTLRLTTTNQQNAQGTSSKSSSNQFKQHQSSSRRQSITSQSHAPMTSPRPSSKSPNKQQKVTAASLRHSITNQVQLSRPSSATHSHVTASLSRPSSSSQPRVSVSSTKPTYVTRASDLGTPLQRTASSRSPAAIASPRRRSNATSPSSTLPRRSTQITRPESPHRPLHQHPSPLKTPRSHAQSPRKQPQSPRGQAISPRSLTLSPRGHMQSPRGQSPRRQSFRGQSPQRGSFSGSQDPVKNTTAEYKDTSKSAEAASDVAQSGSAVRNALNTIHEQSPDGMRRGSVSSDIAAAPSPATATAANYAPVSTDANATSAATHGPATATTATATTITTTATTATSPLRSVHNAVTTDTDDVSTRRASVPKSLVRRKVGLRKRRPPHVRHSRSPTPRTSTSPSPSISQSAVAPSASAGNLHLAAAPSPPQVPVMPRPVPNSRVPVQVPTGRITQPLPAPIPLQIIQSQPPSPPSSLPPPPPPPAPTPTPTISLPPIGLPVAPTLPPPTTGTSNVRLPPAPCPSQPVNNSSPPVAASVSNTSRYPRLAVYSSDSANPQPLEIVEWHVSRGDLVVTCTPASPDNATTRARTPEPCDASTQEGEPRCEVATQNESPQVVPAADAAAQAEGVPTSDAFTNPPSARIRQPKVTNIQEAVPKSDAATNPPSAHIREGRSYAVKQGEVAPRAEACQTDISDQKVTATQTSAQKRPPRIHDATRNSADNTAVDFFAEAMEGEVGRSINNVAADINLTQETVLSKKSANALEVATVQMISDNSNPFTLPKDLNTIEMVTDKRVNLDKSNTIFSINDNGTPVSTISNEERLILKTSICAAPSSSLRSSFTKDQTHAAPSTVREPVLGILTKEPTSRTPVLEDTSEEQPTAKHSTGANETAKNQISSKSFTPLATINNENNFPDKIEETMEVGGNTIQSKEENITLEECEDATVQIVKGLNIPIGGATGDKVSAQKTSFTKQMNLDSKPNYVTPSDKNTEEMANKRIHNQTVDNKYDSNVCQESISSKKNTLMNKTTDRLSKIHLQDRERTVSEARTKNESNGLLLNDEANENLETDSFPQSVFAIPAPTTSSTAPGPTFFGPAGAVWQLNRWGALSNVTRPTSGNAKNPLELTTRARTQTTTEQTELLEEPNEDAQNLSRRNEEENILEKEFLITRSATQKPSISAERTSATRFTITDPANCASPSISKMTRDNIARATSAKSFIEAQPGVISLPQESKRFTKEAAINNKSALIQARSKEVTLTSTAELSKDPMTTEPNQPSTSNSMTLTLSPSSEESQGIANVVFQKHLSEIEIVQHNDTKTNSKSLLLESNNKLNSPNIPKIGEERCSVEPSVSDKTLVTPQDKEHSDEPYTAEPNTRLNSPPTTSELYSTKSLAKQSSSFVPEKGLSLPIISPTPELQFSDNETSIRYQLFADPSTTTKMISDEGVQSTSKKTQIQHEKPIEEATISSTFPREISTTIIVEKTSLAPQVVLTSATPNTSRQGSNYDIRPQALRFTRPSTAPSTTTHEKSTTLKSSQQNKAENIVEDTKETQGDDDMDNKEVPTMTINENNAVPVASQELQEVSAKLSLSQQPEEHNSKTNVSIKRGTTLWSVPSQELGTISPHMVESSTTDSEFERLRIEEFEKTLRFRLPTTSLATTIAKSEDGSSLVNKNSYKRTVAFAQNVSKTETIQKEIEPDKFECDLASGSSHLHFAIIPNRSTVSPIVGGVESLPDKVSVKSILVPSISLSPGSSVCRYLPAEKKISHETSNKTLSQTRNSGILIKSILRLNSPDKDQQGVNIKNQTEGLKGQNSGSHHGQLNGQEGLPVSSNQGEKSGTNMHEGTSRPIINVALSKPRVAHFSMDTTSKHKLQENEYIYQPEDWIAKPCVTSHVPKHCEQQFIPERDVTLCSVSNDAMTKNQSREELSKDEVLPSINEESDPVMHPVAQLHQQMTATSSQSESTNGTAQQLSTSQTVSDCCKSGTPESDTSTANSNQETNTSQLKPSSGKKRRRFRRRSISSTSRTKPKNMSDDSQSSRTTKPKKTLVRRMSDVLSKPFRAKKTSTARSPARSATRLPSRNIPRSSGTNIPHSPARPSRSSKFGK